MLLEITILSIIYVFSFSDIWIDKSIKLFGRRPKYIAWDYSVCRSHLDLGWLDPDNFFSMLMLDLGRIFIFTCIGYLVFNKFSTKSQKKTTNTEIIQDNSSSFFNENLIYNWYIVEWKDSLGYLFIYFFTKIKVNLTYLFLDTLSLQIFNYSIFLIASIFPHYLLYHLYIYYIIYIFYLIWVYFYIFINHLFVLFNQFFFRKIFKFFKTLNKQIKKSLLFNYNITWNSNLYVKFLKKCVFFRYINFYIKRLLCLFYKK